MKKVSLSKKGSIKWILERNRSGVGYLFISLGRREYIMYSSNTPIHYISKQFAENLLKWMRNLPCY